MMNNNNFSASNHTICMLDDDCLLIIFKLLDFKDQLTMATVCQHFKLLLQQHIWAMKFKSVSLNFFVERWRSNDFRAYVDCIFPLAEEIRIKNLSRKQFSILKMYSFPNVNDFRFSQRRRFFMSDEDLLAIHAIFPNLLTFSPQGEFAGRYLVHFDKLRHLTLSYCSGLQVTFVVDVLCKLNLHTLVLNTFHLKLEPLGERAKYFQGLVRLEINGLELNWLHELNDPEVFCHIEELVVTDMLRESETMRLFELLSRMRGAKIETIEIANSFYAWRVLNDQYFPFYKDFKKISFVNVDIYWDRELNEKFHSLRELHIFGSLIEEAHTILGLLNSQLEFLNIEQCPTAFEAFDIEIDTVTERRRRPITFNFINNNIFGTLDPVTMNVRGTQNDLLKITELRSKYVNYEPFKLFFFTNKNDNF